MASKSYKNYEELIKDIFGENLIYKGLFLNPINYWVANYDPNTVTTNLDKNSEIKKENNMFKKSDLKDGMKVVTKSGETWLKMGLKLVNIEDNGGWLNFNYYNDKLENNKGSEWNIVKVMKFEEWRWVEVPFTTKPVTKSYVVAQEGFTATVTLEGDKTTVLLPSGVTASTVRVDPDKYDEKVGIQVALTKAFIKSYQKQLNELRN